MVGMSGKRKRLTLQEKLEALIMLESGSLLSTVMYKFAVSTRFVEKLKSEGVAMLEQADKDRCSVQTKTLRRGHYPEIQEKVHRLVELARSGKIPDTHSKIKECAFLICGEALRRNDLDKAKRAQTENFTASVEWCVNFVKRHGMSSIALHGQGASTTVEEAAKDMARLLECLRDYEVDSVYMSTRQVSLISFCQKDRI